MIFSLTERKKMNGITGTGEICKFSGEGVSYVICIFTERTAGMRQRIIILRGIVEGIGMRPALYRFSVEHGLRGYVCNLSGFVKLLWQGDASRIEQAFAELGSAFPDGSRVEFPPVFTDSEADCIYSDFSIIKEDGTSSGQVNRLTPPDRAPCAKCLAEIHSSADRHSGYAFNSCAECGPRATVIECLPYEREHTAWKDFPLCPDCRKEYENPADRRFHVEGISCPKCGPHLELLDSSGCAVPVPDPINGAVAVLERGGILALKGVGGFQLLADPRSAEAIDRLRKLKHRREKPLALMGRSLEDVRSFFHADELQAEVLRAPAAPIVLLEWKEESPFHPALLAPDNPAEAGVMLPASPLHELLMRRFSGSFLIATSGNRGGEPPALDHESAVRALHGKVDGFLTHCRQIYWRHDDSLGVVNGGQFQLWRRARGYEWSLPWRIPRRVVALGGLWKNTFAVADRHLFLLSPHHGGLEDAANADAWEQALNRILAQVGGKADAVAVDLHPDYFSSIAGERLARREGMELCRVPHHYAHALAGLMECGGNEALALVFDGTGLGPDGRLWGAELLDVSLDHGGRRLATWKSAPLPGGELAVREPWRQFAGRCFAARMTRKQVKTFLPEYADKLELMEYQCIANLNTSYTPSAGRLFDAVSALLGIAPERISYEGQAAIRLEAAARKETAGESGFVPYVGQEKEGVFMIDWTPLFGDCSMMRRLTARGFHESVADAALSMVEFALAKREGSLKNPPVILTGGVFQNRLLTELVTARLVSRGMEVFIPRKVPPNDGGISVGQALWSGLQFRISGVDYTV